MTAAATPLFHSPYGLFPCQQDGVVDTYTTGSGLIVADVGIGKSVIAMAVAALLFEDEAADLVVLACKQNKIIEWEEDLAAFTTLTYRTHHGPARARQLERHGLPQVLISTFETLRSDFAHFAVPPGKRRKAAHDGPLLTALLDAQAEGRRVLVVYDEISDKLRNRSSQMYKAHEHALNRLRAAQSDLRAVGLTATPLSTSYEDGFNLLRLLVPAAMPMVGEFEKVVVKSRDDYGRPRYRDDGVEAFIALARPYLWRKRKTDPDVREMFPKRVEEFRRITMPEAQAKLYRSVADLQQAQEQPVPGLHVALRQIAAHPAALIHSARRGTSHLAAQLVAAIGEGALRSIPSGKTDELCAYLAPIIHGQRDKAVVFSAFGPSVLPLLAEALRKEGIRSHLYYGEMSGPEREKTRRAFRSDPDPCVLLTSDAGKDGINLPEATYVIEYESALTYETRTQRFGRIDRINSTAPSITCTTFVLSGTVEEPIVETVMQRNEMAERFQGDLGAEGHTSAAHRRAALVLA